MGASRPDPQLRCLHTHREGAPLLRKATMGTRPETSSSQSVTRTVRTPGGGAGLHSLALASWQLAGTSLPVSPHGQPQPGKESIRMEEPGVSFTPLYLSNLSVCDCRSPTLPYLVPLLG